MPSTTTKVKLGSPPRIDTKLPPPGPPVETARTPATSFSDSSRERGCWRSISSAVMLVVAGVAAPPVRVAVTMIAPSSAAGISCAALSVLAVRPAATAISASAARCPPVLELTSAAPLPGEYLLKGGAPGRHQFDCASQRQCTICRRGEAGGGFRCNRVEANSDRAGPARHYRDIRKGAALMARGGAAPRPSVARSTR